MSAPDVDPMGSGEQGKPLGGERVRPDPLIVLAFEFAARSFEAEYGVAPREDRGSDG